MEKKHIYCCGNFRPNRKGTPQDLALKTTKVKAGDIHVRTRANLTAIQWHGNRDMHVDEHSKCPNQK
jgi:hypothetical protein